jgi:hypothetical protein
LPGHVSPEDYPGASEIQLAALELLVTSSLMFDSKTVEYHMNAAEEFGNDSTLFDLPDDNWENELLAWEQYVWSQIQVAVADYAIGAEVRAPGAENYHKNITTEGERALCGMQKMRSPGGFV